MIETQHLCLHFISVGSALGNLVTSSGQHICHLRGICLTYFKVSIENIHIRTSHTFSTLIHNKEEQVINHRERERVKLESQITSCCFGFWWLLFVCLFDPSKSKVLDEFRAKGTKKIHFLQPTATLGTAQSCKPRLLPTTIR